MNLDTCFRQYWHKIPAGEAGGGGVGGVASELAAPASVMGCVRTDEITGKLELESSSDNSSELPTEPGITIESRPPLGVDPLWIRQLIKLVVVGSGSLMATAFSLFSKAASFFFKSITI